MTAISASQAHALQTPDEKTGGATIALPVLLALCVIAALAGRLGFLADPYRNDSGIFVYMGKLIAEGGRFGFDLSDNKFPTVALLMSVFWRAFGDNWTAYVLLQTVLGISGALLLARAAALYIGKHASLPTALFTLVYFNLQPVVFTGFQLETLHGFFAILGACAALAALTDARDLSAFAVGLAAGCAAMAKPSGLAVAAAFGAATLLTNHPIRRKVAQLLLTAAGVTLVAVVNLTCLIASDSLKFLPDIYREVAAYASKTPLDLWDLTRPLLALIVVGFPLLLRGWLSRRDRIEVSSHRAIRAFVYLWLAAEICGVILQRRLYPYHFIVLAPPFGLLFGMIPRRNRIAPLAIGLLPAILLSIACAQSGLSQLDQRSSRLPLSDYLVAHTHAGDSIWQDNMGRLLIETALKPGARCPLTFTFCNDDQAPIRLVSVMLHDFDERRPRYIILTTKLHEDLQSRCEIASPLIDSPERRKNYLWAWGQIEAYVNAHYSPETRIDRETVYRRRD